MRFLPAILGAALSFAAAAQGPIEANPKSDAGIDGEVRVHHIGPYTIPAARIVSGRTFPGEFEQVVPAPSAGDVWMTGFDSRIVDPNRVQLDPEKLYLHHGVLVNRGATDQTCILIPGERFAASGAERIPIMLPQGYGYRIRGTDTLFCILHMQNYTFTPQTVYYQYSLTVMPGTAALNPTRPLWLDVVPCASTYVVPVGTGVHVKSVDITIPQRVRVLTWGPHLHCGGTKLDLIDKTNGNTLIRSFANRNPCPVDLQASVLGTPLVINGGTVVTLAASYQQDPTKGLDAMGILLSYVVIG